MTKIDELKSELSDILNKVADQLNLKHYDVELNIESDKGDGFLGEFFLGNVIDKETNKTYHIAIKKAVSAEANFRKMLDLNSLYRVENLFYTEIFPAFDKFQRDAGVKDPFNVTKCYFGIYENFHEAVVMENVREQGYTLHDKSVPLDEEQIKRIFKEYGRFHALSLAFKEQNKEEYEKLAAQLPPMFSFMNTTEKSHESIVETCNKIYKMLDTDKQAGIIEQFEPYIKSGDMFRNAYKYEGDYGTILHGDCWSNNMMFKYDKNGKIDSLRILDFQLSGVGSLAHDLSYFFYAGASKKDFYKLDEYLDLYYESFSSFAKELNSDPHKLYPREQLTLEWKKHGKGGMIMAFLVINIKGLKKEDVGKMATSTDISDFSEEKFSSAMNNVFRSNSIDVLEHAYNYGVL